VAPVFRTGGFVPQGPAHEQGGIGLYANGKKVGEMEGDEPIISKASAAANPELINALLGNYGKRLSVEDITGPIPRFNYGRATESLRMEKGGAFNYARSTAKGSRPMGGEKESYESDLTKYNGAMLSALQQQNQLLAEIARKTGISLFDLDRAQNDKIVTEDLNRMS
jgi:hypothetical protein